VRHSVALHDIPRLTVRGETIVKSRLYDLAAVVRDSRTVDKLVRADKRRQVKEEREAEAFFSRLGWR